MGISGERLISSERNRMLPMTRVLGEEVEFGKDEMDGVGMMEGRRCSWR